MDVAILDFSRGLTWFPEFPEAPLGAERTVTHSTTYNGWQWLYFQLSWTQFTISLLMLLELNLCSSYNNTTKQPSCTCFNKALYCIKGIVQNWKFLILIFNQNCIVYNILPWKIMTAEYISLAGYFITFALLLTITLAALHFFSVI